MPAFTARTGILIPHTVTDLTEFSANYERQLVWVEQDPAGAAAQYRSRTIRNPFGGDGVVCLKYRGEELLGPKYWDDVDGIWNALVEMTAGYLSSGSGQGLLDGQPVNLILQRAGRSAIFGVAEKRFWIDPADFIAPLLDAAQAHFTWHRDQVGRGENGMLQRISLLREA